MSACLVCGVYGSCDCLSSSPETEFRFLTISAAQADNCKLRRLAVDLIRAVEMIRDLAAENAETTGIQSGYAGIVEWCDKALTGALPASDAPKVGGGMA